VCSCASCRRRRAKETNTKFQSHRGKKRRGVEEELPPTPKKRKYKPESNYDKEDDSSIIDSLQYTMEQTPRRKLLLRKKQDEKKTTNSTTDDSYSNYKPSLTSSASRKRRVTLKDLIDSQILSSGDELSFRNSEELAVLLQDGQILWSDTIFKSLSTFAKSVAHLVGAGTKGALYNGWRVVYCRGKVMDSYRKKYERSLDRKNDEIEESEDTNSAEEDIEVSPDEDGAESPAVVDVDLAKPDRDSEFTSDQEEFTRKIRKSKLDLADEEQMNNSTKEDQISNETWWESDCDEDYDPFGTSMFGLYDCYSPLNHPEEEPDLLIMGNNQLYLDIGDKDFFNIAEGCGSAIITNNEGSLNNTMNHAILIYSRNESVEDFYNGYDCDY